MLKRFAFPLCAFALAAAGCNNTGGSGGDTGAPASTQTTAPTSTTVDASKAYVRAIHVVPGVGPFNVVALEVASNEDMGGMNDVTYGNASRFAAVPAGEYKFYAMGTNRREAGPMPVTLERGEDMTVVINGVSGDIALMPFKHENGGPEAGQAKVSFLHAAKSLPAVDVLIDGKRYRGGVKYGVGTDYRVLAPGRHTMQISYSRNAGTKTSVVEVRPASTPTPAPTATPMVTTDASGNTITTTTTETEVSGTQTERVEVKIPQYQDVSLTQELDLAPGKVYSVIVFQDEKKLPKLRLLEDLFAAELKNVPGSNAGEAADNATSR